ncbi:MAG: cation transporter [Deltaproteobacteria bacterium]|nr:cation transporter [Deltaproteobacteria bacterium]MBW2394804.1 cation transporter [Deltaproteobacteria bacterium]
MGADRQERLRAGWASAAVGASVFAVKLAAWIVTGSTAVFADAMESVVNVVAAALLLVSLYVASRPADEGHPYGHGKIEYFSAGIEGALIAVAAVLIAVESVGALISGASPQRIGLGLGLVVAASVANALLGVYLLRTGRRTHSAALVADGKHVLADVWTSAGVIVGMAAVWATGWARLDPLVALVVAAHVLREGWLLAKDAAAGLMDAADTDLLERLATTLGEQRQEGWIDVHGLRAWRAGADVHADLHLVVPRYYDADQLHGIHDAVEHALRNDVRAGDVVVHFDPCRPPYCKGCAMEDCPVRSAVFKSRLPLDRSQAVREDSAVELQLE